MAIGTGRIVRRPWMTSNPKIAGMPCRLPSRVSRCSRLISAGSVMNNNEPASPRASAPSTPPAVFSEAPARSPPDGSTCAPK